MSRRWIPRWSTDEVCGLFPGMCSGLAESRGNAGVSRRGRNHRAPVAPARLGCRPVTPDELLTAYDDQLRTDAEMARAHDVVSEGPLLWAVFDHGGFVSYRDLGGVGGEDLDALVERTVRALPRRHGRRAVRVEVARTRPPGGPRRPARRPRPRPRTGGDRHDRRGVAARRRRAPRRDACRSRRRPPDPARTGCEAEVTRMLAAQESVFGTGRGPSIASSIAELDSATPSSGSPRWTAGS